MKKLLIILLIPVFLLATTAGMAVSSHYCKGKLAEKSFKIKVCCEDVNKGGCCETEKEFLKFKDHFQKNDFQVKLTFSPVIISSTIYYSNGFPEKDLQKIFNFSDKAPPHLQSDLCVLNCIFRL